jgi:glycerol-3-phosphate dehydrogenase
MVKELLNIDCSVVMGANIANEVAAEDFCETTIGILEIFTLNKQYLLFLFLFY